MLVKKIVSTGVFIAASAVLLMSIPSITFAADASYEKVFKDKNATGDDLARAFFDLLYNTPAFAR